MGDNYCINVLSRRKVADEVKIVRASVETLGKTTFEPFNVNGNINLQHLNLTLENILKPIDF